MAPKVEEMIEGLVWSRSSLLKLHDHNVVVRRDVAEDAALRDQRVALVSGTTYHYYLQPAACCLPSDSSSSA